MGIQFRVWLGPQTDSVTRRAVEVEGRGLNQADLNGLRSTVEAALTTWANVEAGKVRLAELRRDAIKHRRVRA